MAQNNNGSIWVENCEFVGAKGVYDTVGDYYIDSGSPGAQIDSCAAVAFVRCGFQGGEGAPEGYFGNEIRSGGDGIQASYSKVAVYDSALRGGRGGTNSTPVFVAYAGGPGGHGLAMDGGFLFVSGSDLTGGDGGDGYTALLGGCGAGGDGGDGLRLTGSPPLATHLDTVFVGGAGGVGGIGGTPGCAPNGSNGVGVRILAGSVVPHSGSARSLVIDPTVRELTPVNLTVTGQAGDLTFLLLSATPGFKYHYGLSGVLLLDPSFVYFGFALLPPSGALTVAVPVPNLPPSLLTASARVQLAVVPAGSGIVMLGAPSALVLLDAQF